MTPIETCGAVVVAHARLDLARECVRSLMQWLPPERIVVVLNVRDAADADGVEATLVSPLARAGYGANLNLGVATLPAGLMTCVLANDDVVFEPESLPRLLAVLEAQPRAGLVGPQFVDESGRELTSFAPFPTVAEVVERAAVLPSPLWQRVQQREAPPIEIGFPVGAALLVRIGAFESVAGFDEGFFLNWEEADFAYRLRRAGWGVTTCPEAIVRHHQGESISSTLNFESFYASLRLYFRKRLGPVRFALLELLLIGVFAASAVYAVGASLFRPRTARHRFQLIADRWSHRIFLRSSTPRRG